MGHLETDESIKLVSIRKKITGWHRIEVRKVISWLSSSREKKPGKLDAPPFLSLVRFLCLRGGVYAFCFWCNKEPFAAKLMSHHSNEC